MSCSNGSAKSLRWISGVSARAATCATILPRVANKCRERFGRRGRHVDRRMLARSAPARGAANRCRPRREVAALDQIDHGRHAFDRERCFGDVRRENDFAAADVVEHFILFFGGKIAVKRDQRVTAAGGDRAEYVLAAHDFADAGQENEDVPVVSASACGN